MWALTSDWHYSIKCFILIAFDTWIKLASWSETLIQQASLPNYRNCHEILVLFSTENASNKIRSISISQNKRNKSTK